MALKTLGSDHTFTSGCELWVAPLANNSSHCGLIDWYINGQITKALGFSPTPLGPQLKEILRDNEIMPPAIRVSASAPVLIAVQGKLPTRWILLVDFSLPAKEWTRAVVESAQGLGVKTARLFSGSDFRFEEFDRSWGQVGRPLDLQIIRSN